MANSKNEKPNKRMYGTITTKANSKYLVTFDFGKIDGECFRKSKQYDGYQAAEDALTCACDANKAQ